tara:strand:- start:801 stop:1094 length:294 start_codon:yes stop_codon:yes gene_type:complete
MPTYVYPEDSENMLINDANWRQEAYIAMQDFASKIQEIISGNGVTIPQEELDGFSAKFKKEIVSNNVAFLETLVNYDVWTTEDMTAVNQAITDGNAY